MTPLSDWISAFAGLPAGHIFFGDDPGRGDPDDQFSRHAVALAVGLGLVGTHIASTNPRCPVQELLRVIAQAGRAVDLDKRKRRRFIVNAQADSRVTPQVGRLDAGLPGRKDQRLTVHIEPDRDNVGMAVFFDRGALGGASLFGQKGPDFVGRHPFHDRNYDLFL